MNFRVIRSFDTDDRGAVGPMYALALTALIAIAGIGFDYGRLAAAQSELQNAADQAALAAATQLDGKPDAMTRAETAARTAFATAASAYVNETRVANDGSQRPVTTLTFTFYEDYAADQPVTELAAGGDGTQASVVKVTASGRKVFYALTPVVAAISSGDIAAHAMARLKKAVCNLPPMMVCINRADFQLPATPGLGLKMHWRNSQLDPLAPGNFSFLQLYKEKESQTELGENQTYSDCARVTDVDTEPGVRSKETEAMNTRFDVPMQSNKLACNSTTGDFCPAENTRKNRVIAETKTVRTRFATPPAAPQCGDFDTRATVWTENTAVGNFKQDDCFADGTCSYLGKGVWDINGYLATNHPGMTASDFPKGTRYSIYQWELQDKTARLAPRRVSSTVSSKKVGSSGYWEHTFVNQCAYAQPLFSPALPASATQKDRRVLTIAAVDCSNTRGMDDVDILAWFDAFLIEPTTSVEPGTINAEVIGPALRPGNLSGFQYYGRNQAVLIR